MKMRKNNLLGLFFIKQARIFAETGNNGQSLMIRNSSLKWQKYSFQIILFFVFMVTLLPAQTIQLFITGNINAAVADCQCGESKNGSLARLTTFYNINYSPEQIWVDAGNFLTSYRFPEHNSFFMEKFSALKYNVISLGEQEFFHGEDFFNDKILTVFKEKTLLTNYKYPQIEKDIKININGEKINFLNIWPPSLVSAELKTKINFESSESLIHKYIGGACSELVEEQEIKDEIIIVIFQGNFYEAQALLKKCPFITGIILGNNEEDSLQLNLNNKSFILSPGIEAEKIGWVELQLTENKIEAVKAKLIDLTIFAEEDKTLLQSFKKLKSELKEKYK
ncbi:MAG: hypothetical protein KAR38_15270 [Calditrichia bacterium]|nr:hypothetical protein [Calditrichia bacterium]